MMGTVKQLPANRHPVPFRVLESGHKVFYDFKTFKYVLDRMRRCGIDDIKLY